MMLQRITGSATVILGVIGLIRFYPSIVPGSFIPSIMGIASLCALLLSLLWITSGTMLFALKKYSYKLAIFSYLITLLFAFAFSFLIYHIAGSVGNYEFHPFNIKDFKMVFPDTLHNELMPFSLTLIFICVILVSVLTLSGKQLKKEKEEKLSGNIKS